MQAIVDSLPNFYTSQTQNFGFMFKYTKYNKCLT